MSEHTPGPWEFDPDNTGKTYDVCYGIYSYPDPQGWAGPTVAHVPIRSHGRVPVNEEGARANARLIAAAPDLLYALKAMRDRWHDYHDAHHLTRPVTVGAGIALELADNAIAKAEGRK